jgi:hypothetical protein
MRHRQPRPGVLLGALLLALGTSATAHAFHLRTSSLRPPPGGRLVCTVVNLSGEAIGITAQIVGTGGTNVTDFISTSWRDETAGVLDQVVSESRDARARYCRITVDGSKRRRSVRGVLDAFDRDGKPTGTAEAR